METVSLLQEQQMQSNLHSSSLSEPQQENDCRFCCASLPSVRKHIELLLKRHPGYANADIIKNFFKTTVNKYLSSYGLGLARGKSVDENVTKRYLKKFDEFVNQDFLEDIEITIDSGGFQVQMGYIDKSDTSKLIQLYYDFLLKYWEKYHYAFLLDIAPGPTSSIYSSWEEIERYNIESYRRAALLPPHVRRKIEYIHHFRTPKINKIWKKLLFEEKLADPFENFATGGLVSFAGAAKNSPIILYVIPLVSILVYAKSRGLKRFRFHVLGCSDFKDIVFHKFAEHHIKKVHDIDIQITYDSSSVFKILALSRFTYFFDKQEKCIWKLYLREDDMERSFKGRGKVEDVFFRLLNEELSPYGFRELVPGVDRIYTGKNLDKDKSPFTASCNKGGNFTHIAYTYGLLHLLKLFSEIDSYAKEIVSELYPLYESISTENSLNNDFDSEINRIMVKLNNGKISKTTDSRTASLYNSLKILTNLDIDYCDMLVDKYMSADECQSLACVEEPFPLTW